jgi:predicted DNA-binding transcriptional regulator AlpA
MNFKPIEATTVRLLGWDDLRAKGIKDSKPTIYRKIKAEKFPAPVYPGKSPAWPEHEIDAYILGLIVSRDARRAE